MNDKLRRGLRASEVRDLGRQCHFAIQVNTNVPLLNLWKTEDNVD